MQAGMASGANPDHIEGMGIVSVMGVNKPSFVLIDATYRACRWFLDASVMDSLPQSRARTGLVRKAAVSISYHLPYKRHIIPAPTLGFANIRAAVLPIMFAAFLFPLFIRQGRVLLSPCVGDALAVLVVPSSFLLKCLTHINMVTHSNMVTQP